MLTEKLSHLFDWLGAEWVMWLLIALGILALFVAIERALFFRSSRVDVKRLVVAVRSALAVGDRRRAADLARSTQGFEGRVLLQGLEALDRGPVAVEEIVKSAIIVERLSYDRYLSFLGTLGNNAPFIGLFGTVLGIVGAFGKLSGAGQGSDRANAMMGSISEALVATAIGLLVAIPAVVAFNQFKTLIKERIACSEALLHELLAHLASYKGDRDDSSAPRKQIVLPPRSSPPVSAPPAAEVGASQAPVPTTAYVSAAPDGAVKRRPPVGAPPPRGSVPPRPIVTIGPVAAPIAAMSPLVAPEPVPSSAPEIAPEQAPTPFHVEPLMAASAGTASDGAAPVEAALEPTPAPVAQPSTSPRARLEDDPDWEAWSSEPIPSPKLRPEDL
ncbi:MAG: MotA/TolQ/ExbB proton channel family protein [Myxococcales bacterium]|nr:MotA/TolQ/ExbB proton channel family protein [Myxococcales bacterium]